MTETTSHSNLRHDSSYSDAIAGFCRRDYQPPDSGLRDTFPSEAVWQSMRSAGTALWLDTGDVDAIHKLWTREFDALTTNNTLLNKEVQKGIYDRLVPDAAKVIRDADAAGGAGGSISDDLLVQEIAFILNAVHGLKLVSTFGADVSVELHTNVAFDPDASFQYGKRFAAICPEHFIVKVPLTPEGLIAARRLRDDGVRINFTLGFSARQNRLIAAFSRPNWVNVFMGRLNAFVKNNGLGDGNNVGEKATLASQRMLLDLNRARGTNTLQIGASIRNGPQCFDLSGVDALTIPTAAAQEFKDMNPDKDAIVNKVEIDPTVTLDAGFDLEKDGLSALWSVTNELEAAVDALEYGETVTGDDIRQHFRDHGVPDLFPDMTTADRDRIQQETKIPKRDTWRDRVAAGSASWDGLLTEAALMSFAQDQAALDDRIRKFL
ncbi:MAG: transaldolase family protein [Planctomycetota bacterium]|jgi:transaldolase